MLILNILPIPIIVLNVISYFFVPDVLYQGSHGREKGRELFFPFPTLKRSGRMIFFNKVGKWSGKMKSANDNFPKVQITRKFGIDLLQ